MTKLTVAALALAVLAGCEANPEASADSGAYSESQAYADSYTPHAADLDAAPLADYAGLGAEADLASAPAAQSPAAVSPPVSADAPGSADVPSALAGRSMRRSADLRVSTDDYAATLRDARALAPRFGGLVTGEAGSSDTQVAQTTLTLRVPSDRFDAALDALAGLGEVQSRAVSVDDVTGQVVDLEARLRAKRAAEARYVGFVGQAGSVAEMMSVQRQLDGVRAEIEAMESHVRSLQSAVSLSTIRVTVVGAGVVTAPAPAPGVWAQVASGLAAGWYGVLAVVIGVLPLWPLAVMGAAGFALWRRWHLPATA